MIHRKTFANEELLTKLSTHQKLNIVYIFQILLSFYFNTLNSFMSNEVESSQMTDKVLLQPYINEINRNCSNLKNT